MLNAFTIKERGSMGKIYKNEQLSDELIKIKHRGKIYTPDYLVKIILNQGNYVDGNINKKHVIDNSCGDGQFIVHIVDRYVNDFFKNSNNISELKNQLETYIHAIEIDKNEINTCIDRCGSYVLNIPSSQLHKSKSVTDLYYCISIHFENEKYAISFLGLIRKKDILEGKVGILYKTGTTRVRADKTTFRFISDTYEVEFKDFLKPFISEHIKKMNGFKLIKIK